MSEESNRESREEHSSEEERSSQEQPEREIKKDATPDRVENEEETGGALPSNRED